MNQGRDGDGHESADATYVMPPEGTGQRSSPADRTLRPGAPLGPPPPPEAFRPAGPPPPADAFRPGVPLHRGRPAGTPAPGGPPSTGPASGPMPTAPAGGSGPQGRVSQHAPGIPPTSATTPVRRRSQAAGPPGDPQPGPGEPAWPSGPQGGYAHPRDTRPHDTGGWPAEGEGHGGRYDSGGHHAPPPGATGGQPVPAQPRPRRRRRRVLLISLIVLIILLIVGDRVAVAVAKDVMAKEIKASVEASLDPSDTPPVVREVSIGGFPFLTQVLFGNFKDIRVVIEGIPTPGPRIQQVDARLKGVHVPFGDAISDNVGKVPVDDIKATVLLTYDDLNAYLATQQGNVQVNPVDDGRRVEIVATVPGLPGLGDQQIGGVTTFEVQNNMLTLVPSEITLRGGINFNIPIPENLVRSFLAQIPIPIAGLPFDLNIESARTTATGLALSATAKDVVLPEAPKDAS